MFDSITYYAEVVKPILREGDREGVFVAFARGKRGHIALGFKIVDLAVIGGNTRPGL